MTVQLRTYTINRGKLAEFAQAWRAGVYPLRLQRGAASVEPGPRAVDCPGRALFRPNCLAREPD